MNHRYLQIAFGTALKSFRRRRGIKQGQLAARTGLHRTYISNVERGRCNLSLVSISKLASALETTVSSLTSGLELCAAILPLENQEVNHSPAAPSCDLAEADPSPPDCAAVPDALVCESICLRADLATD
jgi:transcriptional regulator with XRE-family HTH domain